MSKNKIINNILLFALVFLMAYGLGLSVVNLINRRLENISIKMPPVNVAAPQVNINYDPSKSVPASIEQEPELNNFFDQSRKLSHCQFGGSFFGSNTPSSPTSVSQQAPSSPTSAPTPPKQAPSSPASVPAQQEPSSPVSGSSSASQQVQSSPSPVSQSSCTPKHSPRNPSNQPALGGCQDADLQMASIGCRNRSLCTNDGQCNQRYGCGSNKCVNGSCQCKVGAGDYCQSEPTYYIDPKMMSPQQVAKFKARAKIENMTLKDYMNWLSLFDADVDNLPLVHRKNYWRMKRGDVIKFVPLNSSDYDPSQMPDNYRGDDSGSCNQKSDTMDNKYPEGALGGTLEANGSITPFPTGGRGPGGQPAGMPDDMRLYRTWGNRKLAPAGINPTSDDLVEVNLRLPAVEVDTPVNYKLTDNRLNTSGYIDKRNDTSVPLQWTNYADAFQPNRKYVEYNNKVAPFKTTLVSSWYQNRGPELSDLIESTFFDPKYRCG